MSSDGSPGTCNAPDSHNASSASMAAVHAAKFWTDMVLARLEEEKENGRECWRGAEGDQEFC
ncbi:hypothetical protein HK101_006018, partial [Irineochytrium annulatum]